MAENDRLNVSAIAELRRPVKAIAIYLSIAAGRLSPPFQEPVRENDLPHPGGHNDTS
jgi:hypothetical protein